MIDIISWCDIRNVALKVVLVREQRAYPAVNEPEGAFDAASCIHHVPAMFQCVNSIRDQTTVKDQ